LNNELSAFQRPFFPGNALGILQSTALNWHSLKLSKSLEKSRSSLICHAYEKASGTQKFLFRNSSLVVIANQTRQYV
jgi:hypothetical protein